MPPGGPFLPLAGGTVGPLYITATGSTTSRSVQDRWAGLANVLDFGAKCDGTTDDTAAVNAAIAHASSIGGGVIQFPRSTCLMLGAMVIPYTGTTNPIQPPIRLTGAGGSPDSYLGNSGGGPSVPTGGSIIDMRYAGGGAAVAKIDTRGAGVLEIDHLTITDNTPHASYSNTLFIQTTNTTVFIHDCRFRGDMSASGTACLQDCIRLGAIVSGGALGTNAATAGFQGYGSKIENNQFDYIREGVQFGIAANSVYLANNVFTINCGSGTSTNGAYHFYGVDYTVGGNTIYGGVIEVGHYPYGVVLTTLGTGFNTQNVFDSIGLYDENMGAPTLGGFYFDANSLYNTVYVGFADQPLQNGPLVQGAGAQKNTVINSQGETHFSLPVGVGDGTSGRYLRIYGGNTNAGDGAQLELYNGGALVAALGNYSAVEGSAYDNRLAIYSAGHGVVLPSDALYLPAGFLDVGSGSGSPNIILNGAGSGAGAGPSLNLQWGGTTRGGIAGYSAFFGGAFDSRTVLMGYDGLVLSVQNQTNTVTIDNGGYLNAATGLRVGTATGPSWTTGSGAPAATAPVGSLYSRVGGAVGATLYVSRGGGTWAAVAGV